MSKPMPLRWALDQLRDWSTNRTLQRHARVSNAVLGHLDELRAAMREVLAAAEERETAGAKREGAAGALLRLSAAVQAARAVLDRGEK